MDSEKAVKWWKEKFDAALKPRPLKKREASIYATFNERLMAASIDVTVIFLLLNRPAQMLSTKLYNLLDAESQALLSTSQGVGQLLQNAYETGFITLYLLNSAIQIFLIGVLLVTFQSLVHTTPGKWIMGLKITTSDNETFPSLWRLIIRYVGYIFSCLPFLLGFIWMNFDPKSRAWHDRLAGTRVITMRPQGWYWAQFKRLFASMKDKNG